MNINAEEELRKRAKNVSRDDMEDLLGKESTAERLSKKAGSFRSIGRTSRRLSR